jgi:mannose-1-phosphate guanylyltransferase
MNTDHHYIVIRAGGRGARLWPYSTSKRPKQFCDLIGDETMIEMTLDRIEGLVPKHHIYISTNKDYKSLLAQILPKFPKQNIIIEPESRDTAAAVGLESTLIKHGDPEAIVASIGSDHAIKDKNKFREVLRDSFVFIKNNPDHLLTVGIEPTSAHTGFGYIEKGHELETHSKNNFYIVRRFTEKPDQKTATKFIKTKKYFWNGNLFIWKASNILDLIREYKPNIYKALSQIELTGSLATYEKSLYEIYPTIEKASIDTAVLEKYKHIAVVPVAMGWSDIGDWATLKQELSTSNDTNLTKGSVVTSNAASNILYETVSGKLLAVVGLDDVAVIDTGEALLVCNLKVSQDVKTIVEKIKNDKKLQKYL